MPYNLIHQAYERFTVPLPRVWRVSIQTMSHAFTTFDAAVTELGSSPSAEHTISHVSERTVILVITTSAYLLRQ
jgi:hypothetical protein